jgi:hypothetical protein
MPGSLRRVRPKAFAAFDPVMGGRVMGRIEGPANRIALVDLAAAENASLDRPASGEQAEIRDSAHCGPQILLCLHHVFDGQV